MAFLIVEFGARQVRVGLVVRPANELEPASREELAHVLAIFGVGVPIRLQVVELGEDELVIGIASGHLEVRCHERKARLLEWLPVLDHDSPCLGIGGLRVPPHGVVVEMRDHEHPPSGLGDEQRELVADLARLVCDDDFGVDRLAGCRSCGGDDPDVEPGDFALTERADRDRLPRLQAWSFDGHSSDVD